MPFHPYVPLPRGWSSEQAAQAFMIDEKTLRSRLRRVDEEGEGTLIQVSEPVNELDRQNSGRVSMSSSRRLSWWVDDVQLRD